MIWAFCLGGIGWTFAEYAIHNWVMHVGKGNNELSRKHLEHHAEPNNFVRIWDKFALEAVVVAALLSLGTLAAGWKLALAFVAGFDSSYHFYEFVHERCHTHPPQGPVGRFLRRHHMIHHFVNPNMNHGVTFPFWDMLFGTRIPPQRIVIPERHVMPWLIDPETGDVRGEFAEDYGLRRAPVSKDHAAVDHAAAFSNQALV